MKLIFVKILTDKTIILDIEPYIIIEKVKSFIPLIQQKLILEEKKSVLLGNYLIIIFQKKKIIDMILLKRKLNIGLSLFI